MKKRQCFVSNSSSSSFIAYIKNGLTTRKLAQKMIAMRNFNGDHLVMQKLKELKGQIDDDLPLTFSTINYETFIFPSVYEGENVYCVATSRNHDFYDIDELVFAKSEDSIYDEAEKVKEFYDVENDLYYKPFEGDEYEDGDGFCGDHGNFLVKLTRGKDTGKIVCPVCYKKESYGEEEISI